METLVQDLRYGLRQLRKNPGFTMIAVLTLGLGVAVNATMFTLVSAFLLRRPPGLEPGRGAGDASDGHGQRCQGRREALSAAAASLSYFSVLAAAPKLGRTFQTTEDLIGQDHVVILSQEIWEQRFGSEPLIIGRTIRLNREPYTVIGVMPASFRLLGFTPQVWTPLVVSAADQTATARKDRSLFLFARLQPGVSIQQARADLTTLARRAEQIFPATEKGWSAAVRTLPDFLVYSFGIRSALAVIMTTVGFVLMIACANVAGLLLARASGRRKELAIRCALGAGRLRVLRQLLTESLVIACLGGVTGLLLSYWGIHLVRANLAFNAAISAVPLSLDRNVLLFAAGISVVSALLCGLAPSLSASRTDVTTNLKDESRKRLAQPFPPWSPHRDGYGRDR